MGLAGLALAASLAALGACERREPDAPASGPSSPNAPEGTGATKTRPLELRPPLPRYATPLVLIERRLPVDASAGRVRTGEDEPWRPLAAVGLNLCQTGWILQGFVRSDEGIEATPPFPLAFATLPTAREVEHRVPGVEGSALKFHLEEASLDRLRGWFAVVEGEVETLRMEIDAEPIGIASGAGLGVRGCYTTGFYRIADEEQIAVGPAIAVFDGKRSYYVGLRLSPVHMLSVRLELLPGHRKPQNILRADLARVLEAPQKFPFRVQLELRENPTDAAPPSAEPNVRVVPIPAGEIVAAFGSDRPEGPLRIRLEDVRIPADWEGPLAGRTLDEILVEASFVVHAERAIVPIPRTPSWEVVGPE